jgi:prophage regulatory protein
MTPTETYLQPPPRLLRAKEVLSRVALSRTTIWRMMARGEFPKSVHLTPHRIAWRESDINDFVARLLPADTPLPTRGAGRK